MKFTVKDKNGTREVDETDIGFDDEGNFCVGDMVYHGAFISNMTSVPEPSDVVDVQSFALSTSGVFAPLDMSVNWAPKKFPDSEE